LPNIAIEAILLSVPLVSYDVAGLKELFRGQSDQFIVGQGDIAALTDKVSGMLRHVQCDIYDADNVARLRDEHRFSTMLARKVELYNSLG
jgi:glycosyltransferase involved in cell wall biosynthesis